VQQQLTSRISVEVQYNKRWFDGMYVLRNLALADESTSWNAYSLTAPSDPRLPGGGGYTVNGLYDVNPTLFGQTNYQVQPAGNYGGETFYWDGVDVNLAMRTTHGFTFQGGTSTGQSVGDICGVSSQVPEALLAPQALAIGVATPGFTPWVVPATVLLLFLLFSVQKYGSGRVGHVFGPIMLLWFATIGVLGALQLVRRPAVLLALDPWYAIRLFTEHGLGAFRVLGGVVLAVTGAEALYADLAHFGRGPIRLAWSVVVFPALLLNYFGQGALLLADRAAIASPFYLLAPGPLLVPIVGLATAATIIASQALISGVFSLTKQSILLLYLPRMSIVHTSRDTPGQVYLPTVNTALMIGCLLLVVGFRSSSALGAAYGVAVTGTMAITTALFYVIARHGWRWPVWRAGAVAGAFLGIDLAFFAANIVKVEHGGWVPLVLAGAVFFLMTTWRRGTALSRRRRGDTAASGAGHRRVPHPECPGHPGEPAAALPP